jgi:maltodextrin utilization protein YvdJ
MLVATRQSVEQLIEEATLRLSEAEDQLKITNRNGFEIDGSYSEAQHSLSEIEEAIQKMMDSANHQQREQLHRLHLRVSQCLNDMILDHVDMNQHT